MKSLSLLSYSCSCPSRPGKLLSSKYYSQCWKQVTRRRGAKPAFRSPAGHDRTRRGIQRHSCLVSASQTVTVSKETSLRVRTPFMQTLFRKSLNSTGDCHLRYDNSVFFAQASHSKTDVDELVQWMIERKGLPPQRADCTGVSSDGSLSLFANTDVQADEARS